MVTAQLRNHRFLHATWLPHISERSAHGDLEREKRLGETPFAQGSNRDREGKNPGNHQLTQESRLARAQSQDLWRI